MFSRYETYKLTSDLCNKFHPNPSSSFSVKKEGGHIYTHSHLQSIAFIIEVRFENIPFDN